MPDVESPSLVACSLAAGKPRTKRLVRDWSPSQMSHKSSATKGTVNFINSMQYVVHSDQVMLCHGRSYFYVAIRPGREISCSSHPRAVNILTILQ